MGRAGSMSASEWTASREVERRLQRDVGGPEDRWWSEVAALRRAPERLER
jgi:hypothetical protein